MKTIVIYKSKSGFSQKYAEWIGEKVSAEVVKASKISIKKLQEYDNIIFGAGVYGNRINGVNLITKDINKLQGKKIFVFAVGGTPIETVDLKALRDTNLKGEEYKKIKLFYFRGGFDFSKLSFFYKIVMSVSMFKLKRKKNLSLDEKMMLKAYDAPMNFCSRKETKALTRLIKNY